MEIPVNLTPLCQYKYQVNEALHLSKKERKTIIASFEKIAEEIEQNIDKHSKTLIVSNIEFLLNYCMRFYDRQFITRSNVNNDILTRFENLLNNYFRSGKPYDMGLPTVTYCAEELHLSANYFGNLIKKETGSTALDYIQSKLIDEAKGRIFDHSKTINDIATELGFKYQQHFTRLFKQKVGVTPNEVNRNFQYRDGVKQNKHSETHRAQKQFLFFVTVFNNYFMFQCILTERFIVQRNGNELIFT